MNATSLTVQQHPIRIIIFAKAPIPGLAKTRLIPALGAQGAANLARRMLNDSVDKALAAGLGPVELCTSPFDLAIWSDLGIPGSISLSDQGEGDLGERMSRACERTLFSGESVLLIGTDCPACDAGYLRNMAMGLAVSDAVLAAAADGGYPAIGLNRFDASIFQDIAWSTNVVLEETLSKFRALQWKVEVFPKLHDIDEPQDLKHLPPSWLR
jgi:uncharacterized protein